LGGFFELFRVADGFGLFEVGRDGGLGGFEFGNLFFDFFEVCLEGF